MYADADVQTLRFIKRSRRLGFSIGQIEGLLVLWRDRSRASADVRTLALAHVEDLEAKIHELREMAETLRYLAERCSNDERPECPILAELNRPGREGEVLPRMTPAPSRTVVPPRSPRPAVSAS